MFNYTLSEEEKSFILFGIVLGDGYMDENSIYCYHTNEQKFYVEFLENLCNKMNLDFKATYDFPRKTTFGEVMYSKIRINIPNKKYFIGNEIFKSEETGKKIVSKYVLDSITPLGLLLWYLDDGCLSISIKENKASRFAHLNTQGFSLEENIKIKDMLKERFDIDVSLHKDNSGFEKHKDKVYYRIYFNATNFRKFYDLVREYLKYLPEEFRYKFDMKYTPNRLKNSVEFSQKYNWN